MGSNELPVELFSTCPPAHGALEGYLERVADAARCSEEAGCTGIRIDSASRSLDPWLVAQTVVESTAALSPLVAIRPAHLHPYSLARLVASFAVLHGRRLHLELVVGGRGGDDPAALGDATPRGRRCERLIEYATIVLQLLEGGAPVTFDGDFYAVDELELAPSVPPERMPPLLISGSSPACRAAAGALGALVVELPAAAAGEPAEGPAAIRVGIVARSSDEEAWHAAHVLFAGDRGGTSLDRELPARITDLQRHKLRSKGADAQGEPYWQVPFERGLAPCPYLVGSYERVGLELARHRQRGFGTLLLETPASAEELLHVRRALGAGATEAAAS